MDDWKAFAGLDLTCEWSVSWFATLETDRIVPTCRPADLVVVPLLGAPGEGTFWHIGKPSRAAVFAALEPADESGDEPSSDDKDFDDDNEDRVVRLSCDII